MYVQILRNVRLVLTTAHNSAWSYLEDFNVDATMDTGYKQIELLVKV